MINEKLWNKALTHYQKAEYDEALKICKKLLYKTPHDLLPLNMVGYIMFLNGDLESAKYYWNESIKNGCTESGRHINNINEYERLNSLFIDSLQDIKSHKITAAIDKLLLCSENEFNKISVGELLEQCLLSSKGIKINRQHIDALLNKHTSQYSIQKINNTNMASIIYKVYRQHIKPIDISPNFIKLSVIAASSVVICILFYNVFNNIEFTALAAKEGTTIEEDLTNPIITTNNKGTISEGSLPTVSDENTKLPEALSETIKEFTIDSLNTDIDNAITSKNADIVYLILNSFSKDELPADKLSSYEKGERYLKEQGIDYFYKIGYKNFNNKDFESAISYFNKAFTYCDGHYLEPHIIYFLGLSYEVTKEYSEAIKYFEIYANKFNNGDYSAECIYKLVTLYKDIDTESAKKYANIIESNYSNSIYYNKVVKNILYN